MKTLKFILLFVLFANDAFCQEKINFDNIATDVTRYIFYGSPESLKTDQSKSEAKRV